LEAVRKLWKVQQNLNAFYSLHPISMDFPFKSIETADVPGRLIAGFEDGDFRVEVESVFDDSGYRAVLLCRESQNESWHKVGTLPMGDSGIESLNRLLRSVQKIRV